MVYNFFIRGFVFEKLEFEVYYLTSTIGNVLVAAYVIVLDELKITELIVTYYHFLAFQTFEEFFALIVQYFLYTLLL